MDPLAQLSDIHLPNNVHNYPIAPGWWLIAVLVLAFIIYGITKIRQYYSKRKVQKLALKQLAATTEISTMVTILKWAALQYFPREQVAHLTGEAFKVFLKSTLPVKHQSNFFELSGEHFTSVYQNDSASQISSDFSSAAKLWLKHALPPKQDLSILSNSKIKDEYVSVQSVSSTEVENESVDITTDKSGVKT